MVVVASRGPFREHWRGVAALRRLAWRIEAQVPGRAESAIPGLGVPSRPVRGAGRVAETHATSASVQLSSQEEVILDEAESRLATFHRSFGGLGAVSLSEGLSGLVAMRAAARRRPGAELNGVGRPPPGCEISVRFADLPARGEVVP
jgi:hypothetical protein